jgi:hypothetical protein
MIIPFREILRRAGARLSNTNTSITEENDLYPKMKDWANERYERIYDSYPWRASLDNLTLTLTASTLDYALNRDIGKIWAVYDQTNGWPIKETDVQSHIRFYAEDLDQTGNIQVGDPRRYYHTGTYTVLAEIGDTAEKVKVASTSTLDITPNVVHIVGLVSGIELSEDITLTGTTVAQSSYTYDASQKLRISVGTSDETRKSVVGVITVTGVTSSTVFAKVSPYEYAPEYKWIRVSPKPKADGTQPTWLFWYSKRLQLLKDDNDIPVIDCCSALVQGIYADGLREDGQEDKANIAEERFVSLVGEKQSSDTGMNLIEQFTPQDTEILHTLDYGRVIGD